MNPLAAHWEELTTVALLGTDRREPPVPPPGILADLEADLPQPTPSQRLLQLVAACVVARRAGLRPGVAVAACTPAPHDARPATSPEVTATWRRIVDDWPVLEDEWLLAVFGSGRRLAPELVAPAMLRHRGDAVRHARVTLTAGPLAPWLADWDPRLRCVARGKPGADAVTTLAPLPLPPDLVAVLQGSSDRVAGDLAGGLGAGRWSVAHRAVLINFVASAHPGTLPRLAVELDGVDPASPAIGLAFALADLARLRHRMLAELEQT